jgi:hypothetical protein
MFLLSIADGTVWLLQRILLEESMWGSDLGKMQDEKTLG